MSPAAELGNVQTFPSIFRKEELDRMCALGRESKLERAKADYAPKEARAGRVAWLHDDAIKLRIWDVVQQINTKFYRFDLEGLKEPLQYTHYGVGDHFGWHVDMGPGMAYPRKLSMTIQLSEPSAYKGGELQMQLGSWTAIMPVKRGSVIVFPSWTPHRVMPVVEGERKSLVVWAHGAPFR